MTESFNAPIKDSGTRATFSTGAVRDQSLGKGRMDLLPAEALLSLDFLAFPDAFSTLKRALNYLLRFLHTQDLPALQKAAVTLLTRIQFDLNPKQDVTTSLTDVPLALAELAKHFEKGANKYEARNWEKGINLSRFVDSAIRHLCQHITGATDEPHLIASTWNTVCAIQTILWIKAGVLPSSLNDLPPYLKKWKQFCGHDVSFSEDLSGMVGDYLTATESDMVFSHGPVSEGEAVFFITDAALQDERVEAYQNGYDAGYGEGRSKGYDAGDEDVREQQVVLSDDQLQGFQFASTKAAAEDISSVLMILGHAVPDANSPRGAMLCLSHAMDQGVKQRNQYMEACNILQDEKNRAIAELYKAKLAPVVRVFKPTESIGDDGAMRFLFAGDQGYFIYPDGRIETHGYPLGSYIRQVDRFKEVKVG